MLIYDKPESNAAPIPSSVYQSKEHTDCSYLCFYIDPNIYDKQGIILKNNFGSNLSFQETKLDNNLVILCVYCEGLINYALKWIKSKYSFKISYKFNKETIFSCNYDFIVEKNKVKFIYDAAKKGSISNDLFKNPSCLEQYKAFHEVSQKHDIIYDETYNFLNENLDMELFLYLLENKDDDIKNDLMYILYGFPKSLKINYDKNKPLQQINWEPLSNKKYYNILLLLYSVIQDSIDLIEKIPKFDENDILNILDYNDIQKDQPIFIKQNIFKFFIEKLKDEKYENSLKRICRSVYSIPLLFDCLISLNQEQINKIKNLKFDDLPSEYFINDDLIELIEKYEKIKNIFAENEIIIVWTKYLNLWYKQKSIEELENVMNKLISINEKFYTTIITEIKNEIITRWKKSIERNELKSLKMYEFINKYYNNTADFLSDENLVYFIGTNIVLEDLNKDEILKEFNQCKFLVKINKEIISKFINGTLVSLFDFEKFFLYFKFIFPLKKKENEDKNYNCVDLIISHFISLLTKIPKIKISKEFKDVLQKIIIFSLMYIPDDKTNNYIKIITELGNCHYFSREELFELFIETIINSNIEDFISKEDKYKVCEYIINKFYFDLNLEKKIDFLKEIQSNDFKEKIIFIKFPKIENSDYLSLEERQSLQYLKQFIDKGIIGKKISSNSEFLDDIISSCKLYKSALEKEDINFSEVNQLKELIQNKKLKDRVKYICLGDENETSNLVQKIEAYTQKYITYNIQLDILITHYNKYYPKLKKEEIDKYTKQQSDFKEAKIFVNKIEINENIEDEIKEFDKYDKSKFFNIFYNNQDNIDVNDEEKKFENAKETFKEYEKLFNKEDLDLKILEIPLSKLEDNDSNENLIKEINYLKNNFGYKEANEKQIAENLSLYKNRINISDALNSLMNLCQLLSVKNIDMAKEANEKLANDLVNIKLYSDTEKYVKKIKDIDENFLDKNFLEILKNFKDNDKLILFLNGQKESETRDLIDGLFDEESDEVFTVELKDIEILINVVCFFNDIKSKINNLGIFLDNFHSILIKKDSLYKGIVSNIVDINSKLDLLQDYIKIQLGKKSKHSTDIEKFIKKGIIQFKKVKKPEVQDENDYHYEAFIVIEDKEQKFEIFMETIKRIKAKNIYKYGKNKEYLLKAKKIAQLILQILDELNLDITQEFNNNIIEVDKLEFVNKGILKIPQLESILEKLKIQNTEKRNLQMRQINENPNSKLSVNSDFLINEDTENKNKIESFFPSIREIEEKSKNKIFKAGVVCKGCGEEALIKFQCKRCKDFIFCESCIEKYKRIHQHEFQQIDKPVEYEGMSDQVLIEQLKLTQIKKEFGNLKGLFFYKSSKDKYEIDILKFYNKLLIDGIKDENNNQIKHNYKLPNYINLLLCYEQLRDIEDIYTFCVRAINCETNTLFIIVRPEELKINQEKFLFRTLNKKLEIKGNKINSCIVVLYVNQNSHIIKQLKNLKEKYDFPDNPSIFDTIENTPLQDLKELPVEIVTSDSPRVGKTSYILSVKGVEEPISFPLGNYDQKFLVNNLNELKSLLDDNLTVILGLYENPDEKSYNLIKNFLFQILILKIYKGFNCIGKENIKIFIEVSSDYTSTFLNDFKFLEKFKRYHIDFKNHKDFYDINKIKPSENNIHIKNILNYLQALKNEEGNKFKLTTEYDTLIKDYFIKNFNAKNILPNFGQIEMFSDIFGDLIYNLARNQDMKSQNIINNIKKFPFLTQIRTKIIESYIKFVIKFTAFSYESILENQEEAAKHQKILSYKLTDEKKKKLIEEINKKRVVSYNDIKPSVILFNNIPKNKGYLEINTCSILTTYKEEDPEYTELNNFYQNYLGLTELLNLFDFGGPQFIFELKNICMTPDSLTSELNSELKKIGYEFTIDNFVKMVLIYLRIRANVPLILMGETGCGKTSLIESLFLFIKDRYELIKFNIHSGLSYNDITEFFEKENLFEKEEEEPQENQKKIILFLDEINTTNCINLLCDIFIKHSYLNSKLKKNIFIIAACNPYRLMLSDTKEIGYINKKMHRVRNLVYTVNPLPLSMINYVFDFGNVNDEDEKKYINKFVDTFLNEKFSVNNQVNYSKILSIIVYAVYEAQKFIRINSEISAVSLREIKRFKIFFEFFFNITKTRKEFENPDFNIIKDNSIFSEAKDEKLKKDNLIVLKAANLSLFMCFYIRIINPDKRKKLAEILENIIKFDFLEYPLKLEEELANSLNLDRGIAKNRALLDNLFTLFVCLNNKIPVFICGKAGCSKSLSFSLLFQAMKGEYSKNELFRKYPSLYVTSYQGSLTSSSSEIKIVFDRANKVSNAQKDSNKNLSVILFDEMGLAEISPLNPLKVIHSELDGNQQVAFVGISNWTLDASKMNRAIHLSVQEPDLKDLILTATTIATDICEEIEKIAPYKNMIENLTKSYLEYKEHLNKYYLNDYDFHGARDFYNLIKIAARELKNNVDKKSLEKIGMESIERNFGGLELTQEGTPNYPSTKKFKEIFSKHQNSFIEDINKYDILSCIKNNLQNDNNRYLLLITNKTKNDTLIEFILKKLRKEYRFIQGSKLKEDQNEDYILDKTWSIISYMENGETIILKDLEIIYPKFYDLFNQNFQKFGNSQYARIVLDSTTNERHIVNKDFRCIVLLEQSEVNEQDPPFLNRFEKHLMSFEYLLTENQNLLAKNIYNEIKDLTTIPENKKMLPFLVNINLEEIRCLLLNLSSIFTDDYEKHVKDIYNDLIPTFTQENILNAMFSQTKNYISKEDMVKIYEKNSHTNIFKFLEEVNTNKLMVYTFSPCHKDIFPENSKEIVKNQKFREISRKTVLEINFQRKLSEKMLEYFFQLYYDNMEYNLFIIHFKLTDSKYLKYVKYQLDQFHKANPIDDKKMFLFILHIQKNYDVEKNMKNEDPNKKSVEHLEKYHSYFLSYLSEYKQITIDNLLEQRNISVTKLYNKTNEELMVMKELFDINLVIKKEFSKQILQINIFKDKDAILKKIDNLAQNDILECIITKIQSSFKNSDNILRKILVNYTSLVDKDSDFISYYLERIIMLVSENVQKLIKELLKNGYLVSLFFEEEIPLKLKKIIFNFINNIDISKSKVDNLDDYFLDLKMPGSKLLFQKISNLAKNCKIDYLNIENEYRKKSGKKDANKERKTLESVHFDKKQYLKSKLWNEELLNEDVFSEYFEDILKDYFIYIFYDANTKTSLNEKQEEFLQFIYSKKIEGDTSLDRFFYFCLWIGSYYETILKILDIYTKLDKYFKPIKSIEEQLSLFHDSETLLDTLKENYDIFSLSKEFGKENVVEKEKVNDIFYRISEVFCYVITNINNIDMENLDLKKFCTELNEVSQKFIQLNTTLKLDNKGQYTLMSICKIIEFTQKNKVKIEEKEFKKILGVFIQNIFAEKFYISRNDIYQAKKAFDEQIKISNNFSNELSSKIFVNKFLQYSRHEKYKYELIKTLFQYPNIIKYSSLFFNFVFITQSIKPKMQKDINISDEDKAAYIKNFGTITKSTKNDILNEINIQAENNEILKEILLYIFELRILSYFEDCEKSKIMKKNNKIFILTGLNFDYFKTAHTKIEKKDFGKLNNLGIIFYYSYIRCYLYYFVKLQLEVKELGDLNSLHKFLSDIANSDLGKMFILYIAKLFILKDKKKYFIEEYMNDVERYNWKQSIINFQQKEILFPIDVYENSKNLLFYVWSNINNLNNIDIFAKKIDITDLYYIINFAFNEINLNKKDDVLECSRLLIELNKINGKFNFDKEIKTKINNLFKKLTDLNFMKDENAQKNTKFFFNMIKFYILGLIGYKKDFLFSLIFSDKSIYLIKLFYHDISEEEMLFIESYYQIKKYLEKEYLGKDNLYPVYVCSCGRWYTNKDSLPTERRDCKCGLKIGGQNQILVERDNHCAIYYNQDQRNFIETRICGRIKIKGKLLEDFKKEFILTKIISNCKKLDELLINSNEINDETFPSEFLKFIFLSQVIIEYKIGITSSMEIINEFIFNNLNEIDENYLFNSLFEKEKNFEKYIKSKNIDYNDFICYAFDSLFNILQNIDCIKEKNKITYKFKDLVNKLEKKYEKEPDHLDFNKIEMNILTSMTLNNNFKDNNLKYLLTAAQYPNKEQLKKSMSLYKKKPLPILSAFISLDSKNSDMEKLSHIEIINDFINSFAEEFRNKISRKSSEEKTIKDYLGNNNDMEVNEESLKIRFEKFCKSYEKISIEFPNKIDQNNEVKYILNDDKIKGNESPINKLYNHLIEIQNQNLNKILEEYNRTKNEMKEDILIKNAIDQIQKPKPIQLCTKEDVFSFNVSNGLILTFEELYSFYSLKNIFNNKDDKIDYSKYSEIKFKLNVIEKELVNIVLTGKKLFSKEQITYKFFMDPYEVEEKTLKFEKFTQIYGREELTDEEKADLKKQIEDLKKIILPNLEILIFYLIQENKYQETQPINQIKFHSNLYLDTKFIRLFSGANNLTINKLISIYEFIEENLWEFIAERYINEEFKKFGFCKKYQDMLSEFFEDEEKRELKINILTSLLIKFVCRYLPFEKKESQTKNLFKMLREKNMNLSEKIKDELIEMSTKFGAVLSDAIDVTYYFVREKDRKLAENINKNEINVNVVQPNPQQENNNDNNDDEDNGNDDEDGDRQF